MEHKLLIEVFGAGENPEDPSHWAFVINQPPSPTGDMLHVRMMDETRHWFQLETRFGTDIITQQAYGMCMIATLNNEQRRQAIQIISGEDAPRDGKRNCQDWVFSALISLEVEELVPSGTSGFWKGMIGKPAREVRKAVGPNWLPLRRF